MSFPFRDRPSLRDRLRGFGKSGDEIMEELKQSLDEDRKNFFESNSKFGRPGLSRGFPFDDDVMHGKSKLKDHLEDLARRHPELADQLKDWTDIEKSPKIPRGSGSSEQGQSEPKAHPKPPEDAGQGPSRPQQNLRNTVPDMQAQEKLDQLRNARSQSAPPEGPPGKGSTPMPQVNSQTPPSDQRGDQQPSQNHQPQNQQSQQSQSNQQPPQPHVRGNERYIPIFVEGRGEIIVNVPAEKDSGAHAQTPPPRQKKSFKEPQGSTVNQQQPQGQVPTSPSPSPAPSAAPSQESAHQSQQQQQQQQAPPPAQPPRPPSPLTLVATIQKEVEDLKQRVDTFKGSKTDKEYIYLDEMLTRNLLKLDNIESEGRDEVRAARKEVIKLIQQCITTLENLKTTP